MFGRRVGMLALGFAFWSAGACGGPSGVAPCPEGTLTCPCFRNDSCDDGLECRSGVCVEEDAPRGGTSAVDPGDGGDGTRDGGQPGDGGSNAGEGQGGSSTNGGSQSGTGGSNVGGEDTGPSSGGDGGAPSGTGGATPKGGASATGGNEATGGDEATGGNDPTGGTPNGGSPTSGGSGGSSVSGGSSATGGAPMVSCPIVGAANTVVYDGGEAVGSTCGNTLHSPLEGNILAGADGDVQPVDDVGEVPGRGGPPDCGFHVASDNSQFQVDILVLFDQACWFDASASTGLQVYLKGVTSGTRGPDGIADNTIRVNVTTAQDVDYPFGGWCHLSANWTLCQLPFASMTPESGDPVTGGVDVSTLYQIEFVAKGLGSGELSADFWVDDVSVY